MNVFHVLTLLLVVLKTLGLFPYSWWIVLAPSLISIAFGLLVLLLVSFVALLAAGRS